MSDNVTQNAEETQSYNPVLSNKEMSQAISALGIRKANTKIWQLFLLGLLAGVYIGIGTHLFLVAIQSGAGPIVGGAVFGVGLVFVVVAGAELFTGNLIMVVGTLTRQFSVARMLLNWIAVYLGNMAGAFLLVALICASGLMFRNGVTTPLGQLAGNIATAKIELTFTEAFVRGILCNILVLLAILMATMSKDVISKIVCCILPVMAFVASGFEHCIANMYLIPAGLLASGMEWTELGVMFQNIIPVTLGNIVGGAAILLLHPNRIRQLMVLMRGKKA